MTFHYQQTSQHVSEFCLVESRENCNRLSEASLVLVEFGCPVQISLKNIHEAKI